MTKGHSSAAAAGGEGSGAGAISGSRPKALQAQRPEGIAAITHPDIRAQVLQWLESHAAGAPIPPDLEVLVTRTDGAVRRLSLRISTMPPAGGRALQIPYADITEPEEGEAARRQSERLVQAAMDALPVSACLLDAEGHILMVNEEWRRTGACLRIGRERMRVGADYLAALRAASGENAAILRARADKIEALLRGEMDTFTQETPVPLRDGTTWLLTQVRRFRHEGTMRAIVTHTDITEQKRSEEALRSSEARANAVLESIPDLMFRLGRDGTFLEVHAAPEDLYAAPAAYLGRTVVEVGPPAVATAIMQSMERALATGEAQTQEYALEIGGGMRYREARMAVCGADEVIVMTRDVTERHLTTEALRAADARAHHAQRMESVGNLAAGIAHDFNNLLTVIQANLSEAEHRIPEEARPEVRLAQTAARSAAELSEQLLAIGRGSGGPRGSLALSPVVREVYALLRRTVHPDMVLEAEVAPELEVVANASQFRQVLLNLAVNGCAAMPNGGRLVVRANRLAQAPADLPPRPEGYVWIDMEDNGAGMDAETAARAFEPFFTTKGERGNGLGLAVVYGIVREHGGAVTLDTGRGRGTVVHVILPAGSAAGGPAAEAERKAAPAVAERPATILVVDDLEPLRETMATILTRAGYEVLSAGSGAEALAILQGRAEAIDLVVLDTSMPGMTGRQTYEGMRELPRRPRVVFISGYTAETLEGLTPEREWSFLPKPFDAQALVGAVRGLLAGAREAEPAPR